MHNAQGYRKAILIVAVVIMADQYFAEALSMLRQIRHSFQ
jgi:hypothetical protein